MLGGACWGSFVHSESGIIVLKSEYLRRLPQLLLQNRIYSSILKLTNINPYLHHSIVHTLRIGSQRVKVLLTVSGEEVNVDRARAQG